MIHHAAPSFWVAYRELPATVRAGLHHRALGIGVADGVLWFWIGTHSEYDALIR